MFELFLYDIMSKLLRGIPGEVHMNYFTGCVMA